jgi:hypothetical protein
MMRLNLSRDPAWVDIGHGVRLRCAPVTSAVLASVYSAPEVTALTERLQAGDSVQGELGVEVARRVARRVVVEWDGVSDLEGEPVPVTPEAVDALFDHWFAAMAFQDRVVSPAMAGVEELAAEGNGSAPSPAGGGAEGASTATGAGRRARNARRG